MVTRGVRFYSRSTGGRLPAAGDDGAAAKGAGLRSRSPSRALRWKLSRMRAGSAPSRAHPSRPALLSDAQPGAWACVSRPDLGTVCRPAPPNPVGGSEPAPER